MEADFEREYGVTDLTGDVRDGMPWPQFLKRAAGLSPGSTWRAWDSSRKPEPNRLEGEAIDAYWATQGV